MAVLQPLKMVITGRDLSGTAADILVPDFPFDPSRGSHTVRIEETVYIDRSDFRTVDSEDYYGLAPGKVVGLKYAFRVQCESFEADAAGEPVLLRCVALPDSDAPEDKPKGSIQWVPASTAVSITAILFHTPVQLNNAADLGWESEINTEKEIQFQNALIEAYIETICTQQDNNNTHTLYILFDRIGYFALKIDADIDISTTTRRIFTETSV